MPLVDSNAYLIDLFKQKENIENKDFLYAYLLLKKNSITSFINLKWYEEYSNKYSQFIVCKRFNQVRFHT